VLGALALIVFAPLEMWRGSIQTVEKTKRPL
jgi:hypothetical protein